MSAVDLSGTIALGAIGLLTANLLLGLLLSVGYNPVRQWPKRRVKLFTFHNWTGYVALAAVALHAGVLLFSTDPRFSLGDLVWPTTSPVQPGATTIGAVGLYLLAFAVFTSLKRVRAPSAVTGGSSFTGRRMRRRACSSHMASLPTRY